MKTEQKLEKAKLKIEKLKLKLKTKKHTRKELKNKLWIITSKLIRLSYISCYTCDKSLSWEDRQAGHFWSRGGHPATYFDLDNIRTQCVGCNNWKSGNLAEYSVRLRREIGEIRFHNLELRAHRNKKFTPQELEELIRVYQSLLNNMQEGNLSHNKTDP